MAICNHCKHYLETFDEYEGWRWKCMARYIDGITIIPECLQPMQIRQVLMTDRCEYFNKEIDFDHRGLPIIIKN